MKKGLLISVQLYCADKTKGRMDLSIVFSYTFPWKRHEIKERCEVQFISILAKTTAVKRESDCTYTRLLIMGRWMLLAWVTLIGCLLLSQGIVGRYYLFSIHKGCSSVPYTKGDKERKHLSFFPTHSCLPASFCSVKSKTHYPNELSPFNKIFIKTWLLYTGNCHWL